MSTRYVQKLFAEQGTTASEWIRNRRLEKCRNELAGSEESTVASIALRWGYADAASLTRSFKNAYGYTPTEFRCSSQP